MCDASPTELVEEACRRGILDKLTEEYIIWCYTNEEKGKEKNDDKKKSKEKTAKFPNVAGFCRYYGIGQGKYARMSKKYPDEFEKLSAILEDEALNSELSPSLLTAYLKRRLGYSDTAADTKTEVDTGQLKLVFEHDIFADGE